jgi:tetraacyldisaccharide 4'-kinase
VKKKDKEKKPDEQQPDSPADAAAPKVAPPPEKAKKKERKKEPERSMRRLLAPLIPLYRVALNFREMRLASGMEPVRWLRCPVISIGNLSTGGAGKTPFTIMLAKELASHGLPIDVLSRGYGRQSTGVTRVDPSGTAEEFGDEPLLIARETGVPVYLADERYDAGVLAEKEAVIARAAKVEAEPEPEPEVEGATEEDPPPFCIHLLDDGFQHRQLARTVDILLLNRQDWLDRLLPAGNLREPLDALFRANVIAIPANEQALADALTKWGWEKPIWRLHRIMEVKKFHGPVAAFCGIARPEQFFDGLEAAGVELAARFTFPDHYDYDEAIVREMIANAHSKEAKAFVTTTKDLVRLGELTELFPETTPLETAHLRIEVHDKTEMLTWLAGQLL